MTATRGRRPLGTTTVFDHLHSITGRTSPSPLMKRYRPSDEVDFAIVGSGAAGGVMAHELARAGFSVVVLEQGPWLTEKDFSHDAQNALYHPEKSLRNNQDLQTQTRRAKDTDTAKKAHWIGIGRCVGGGTVHFTANYWRCP